MTVSSAPALSAQEQQQPDELGPATQAELSGETSDDLPRVGVLPPLNLTGLEQYDFIAPVVQDTVTLTLRLIGRHEVVPLAPEQLSDPEAAAPADAELREIGLERNLANILFGSVTRDNGRLVVELQVFDTLEETVVFAERQTADLLVEVFEATDLLVAEMLEAFSGVPVGFGELAFSNTGEPGGYEVYLDGTLVGENMEELERVLIGEYEVEIRQERMFEEEIIHSERITVEADERLTVEFAVPLLLDHEAEQLDRLETELRREIAEPRSEERVRELFDRAYELLADPEYSPSLSERRDEFAELEADWLADIEDWRLAIRPRWLLPLAVGWLAPLDDAVSTRFSPLVGQFYSAGVARRFGDSLYLGADLAQPGFPVRPVPFLRAAWQPGEAPLLFTAGGFFDPFDTLNLAAARAGVIWHGFSLEAVWITDFQEGGSAVGGAIGFTF